MDCLELLWESIRERFRGVKKLLLNMDNGPENNSRRTQFIKRIVTFADENELFLQLAYYPPYHSKYNPIERVWGVLEQHWNGHLLTDLETVIAMASSMTYKGLKPIVNTLKKTYLTGVTLCKKAMTILERRLDRVEGIAKYAVNISPRLTTS